MKVNAQGEASQLWGLILGKCTIIGAVVRYDWGIFTWQFQLAIGDSGHMLAFLWQSQRPWVSVVPIRSILVCLSCGPPS